VKGVAASLVLVTLVALAACISISPGASSRQAGEAVTTLGGMPVSPAELEAFIEQSMAKASIAGLSVAITESRHFGINDGQIAYTHAFGYRDKAAGIPFEAETVTGAASLSKTIFAYLVMLLAEEGVIDLDKPLQACLSKPLPEYRAYADERWRGDQSGGHPPTR